MGSIRGKQLTEWLLSFSRNGQTGIKTEQVTKSEGGSSTDQGCNGVDVKGVAVSCTNIVKV